MRKISSKDQTLQRTRDQFLDFLVPQMMEHVEIKVPKISSQEGVEAVKIAPQERLAERMCEQIWVIEVPKISSQESVEAVNIVPQERLSPRMCEQIGVIEVPTISRQDKILQRTVEQTLDESCVPCERAQQLTAKFAVFNPELDALFNQEAVFENIIDFRLRGVKYDKEAAEKEWLDLMRFLTNRLIEIKEPLTLAWKRAYALSYRS